MKRLIITVFIIALALVACKAEPVSEPVVEAPTEPTPVEPSTPTEPTEAGEETEEAPEVTVPAGFAEVNIRLGVEVDPFELVVPAGTEVIFKNQPVVGKKDRNIEIIGDKNDPFKSGILAAGDTYSHIYAEPGTYTYIIAPGSAGKVIVTG